MKPPIPTYIANFDAPAKTNWLVWAIVIVAIAAIFYFMFKPKTDAKEVS